MGLFPELDEQQTIDNVKYYFLEEFPRVKARAHMNLTNVQSPSFDAVGGGNGRNSQEDKIYGRLWAIDLVKATYKTIDNCPEENSCKTILKYNYLYGKSNTEVMELIGYEKSQYNDLKRAALLYFADAFDDYYTTQVFMQDA